MKSILNEKDRKEIVNRIERISEKDERLWGKMDAGQMLCHCSDQIRLSMGEIESTFVGNALQSTLLKNLILWGMPAPKGKVETYKELKQGEGGTPTTNFQNDKKILLQKIEQFISGKSKDREVIHPNFGKLNFEQWGRLIFIHLNHHLKQFGM